MKQLIRFLKLHAALAKRSMLPAENLVLVTPQGFEFSAMRGDVRVTLDAPGYADGVYLFRNTLPAGGQLRKSFAVSAEGVRTDGVLWPTSRIGVYDEFDDMHDQYPSARPFAPTHGGHVITEGFVRFLKETLTLWAPDAFMRVIFEHLYLTGSDYYVQRDGGPSVYTADVARPVPVIPMSFLKTFKAFLEPGAVISSMHDDAERMAVRLAVGGITITQHYTAYSKDLRPEVLDRDYALRRTDGGDAGITDADIAQALAGGDTAVAVGDYFLSAHNLARVAKVPHESVGLSQFTVKDYTKTALRFGHHYLLALTKPQPNEQKDEN